MVRFAVLVLSIIGFVCSQESNTELLTLADENGLADTELLRAFVIFRHGDRTPSASELALYTDDGKITESLFFPYGMGALTNIGKLRAYRVGQYIRRQYDSLLSKLYLPDEITIHTGTIARTKMTALAALAALYPPLPAQKWNPTLSWQPVPYDIMDMNGYYSCPHFFTLREMAYESSELKNTLESYASFFDYLSEKTGNNITDPMQATLLENLFRGMVNVGLKKPEWEQNVSEQLKEMVNIEFNADVSNSNLTRLITGVIMSEIINTTNAAIANATDQPKVILYSAHDLNVAALMSAVNVFENQMINYGASFSVELRKNLVTGNYGITAVFAKDAEGPGQYLKIKDCGEGLFCDYETFIKLTQDTVSTQEQFNKECYE